MEGNRGAPLEVEDELNDFVGWFLSHFEGKGSQGGSIFMQEFDMVFNPKLERS